MSLKQSLRAPIPSWLVWFALAVGMFYGAWLQAEAHTETVTGHPMGLARHVVFLAPVAWLLAMAAVAVRTWKPYLKAVPA